MTQLLDRDEFATAVKTNPTDPALRLVFADWLEERGLVKDAQRERFVGQLLATPYDSETRLGYAQWLAGQGEADEAKQQKWIVKAMAGKVRDKYQAIYTREGLVTEKPEIIRNAGYWQRQVNSLFVAIPDILIVVVSREAPTRSGFRFDMGSPILFYRRWIEYARRRTGVSRVRVV